MDLGLNRKTALVTAASRGIGAAIARQFLREGANVIIVSRGSTALYKTEQTLQTEFPQQDVKVFECDCTENKSVESLFSRVSKYTDRLDVVVANVGDGRSVPDAIPNAMQWDKTWNINFNSALLTARIFLPMLQKSQGCLLFISSIAGLEAFGAPVDYSTAKSAIIALAKSMARKLAREVRVNVLAPGNIYFPEGSWDQKIKADADAVEKIIKDTVPMNRFGLPEEIADAAVFLCSERAAFITGTTLIVDGGQTVGVV